MTNCNGDSFDDKAFADLVVKTSTRRFSSSLPNIQNIPMRAPTRPGRFIIDAASALYAAGQNPLNTGLVGRYNPDWPSCIVTPEPFIKPFKPAVWTPEEPLMPLLLAPPRLIVDEVTKHLKWRTRTYEQQLIDETEQRMCWPSGAEYFIGMDIGLKGDTTAVTVRNSWNGGWTSSLWEGVARATQIPIEYLVTPVALEG